MNQLMSSAISYVLASLFLSGQVLANPADVSGNVSQTTDTHMAGNFEWLAMNSQNRPQAKPYALQIESASNGPAEERVSIPHERYLDGLNKQIQTELAQQINQFDDF